MKVQGLIVIFFGLTGSVIINENVIFQKTNDITVTHAKWLASFVIDLEPFNAFLAKLAEDIDTAAVTAECIINKYRDPDQKEYMSTFQALQKEVVFLNETHAHIFKGLLDYKLLPRHQKKGINSNSRWCRLLVIWTRYRIRFI